MRPSTSSSASTGSTRRAPAMTRAWPAARGSACRSWPASRRHTVVAQTSTPRQATARPSASDSLSRPADDCTASHSGRSAGSQPRSTFSPDRRHMTLSEAPTAAETAVAAVAAPLVDIVVPVHNEERDLVPSITRLHDYLREQVGHSWRITIADNASTDRTWALAVDLAAALEDVVAIRLPAKGRGRALREVWSQSDAHVVAYMDVDLSTDLAALPPLVAPLLSGHSDIAIGTRLSRGARVVRGRKRELISRCYNLLLHAALGTSFTDAQCGFKAIRADRARELLPQVEDTGWFFDTELLVLAERRGLRIHEVPVDWVDDPNSSVNIVKTATADLKGIARVTKATFTGEIPISKLREQLGRQPIGVDAPGVPPRLVTQLVRFAAIGVSSTLAYLVLFLLLRTVVGA